MSAATLDAPLAGLVNGSLSGDLTITTMTPHLEDGWRLYEFVDGQRLEKTMSKRSHYVANNLNEELILWTRQRRAGGRSFVEAPFRCFPHDPDQVRRPDVAYVSAAQLSRDGWEQAYFTAAPDLAVEVISPNDEVYELDRKIGEYLRAGVRRVWVINPEQRTVRVHSATGAVSQWTAEDELQDDEVLPGFRCPAAALFALPGEG